MEDFLDHICFLKSKDFLTKLQPEKLAKMGQAFDNDKAYAQTIFSLKTEQNEEPKIFVGRTKGKIVDPRGSRNFGWDCIFQPEGFEKTYGELSSDIKNKISQRSKALTSLLKYLKK